MNYNNIQHFFPILTWSSFFLFCMMFPSVHVKTKTKTVKNQKKFCDYLDPTEVLFKDKKNISAPQYENPFYVECNNSAIEIDEGLYITLTSKEKHKFRGFIIQSRYGDDMLVGYFIKKKHTKLYDCDMDLIHSSSMIVSGYTDEKYGRENTLVYKHKKLIDSYSLVWKAPDYIKGDIHFYFTVYRDEHTYWQFHTTNESGVDVLYTAALHTLENY